MTAAALDVAKDVVLVGHVARSRILECSPETTVAAAVALMAEARCGSIVVVQGDQAVGIWTGNDVVRLNLADPTVIDTPVAAVMSSPVRSIRRDAPLRDAALRFRQGGYRHLLVVDSQGHRVGIVSQTDVINNQGIEFFVHLRDVRSAMRAAPLEVDVDRPVVEVVELLGRSGQDAVVVTDVERQGIFTATDLLAMIGRRQFSGAVGAHAHFPLQCVAPDASLFEARTLLLERGFRHLGVREGGRLIGLLTHGDILECVEQVYLREMQKALADQSSRLLISQHSLQLAKAVADVSHQGIVITDASGLVESVNPAFTAITGYGADEVLGRDLRMLRSGRHDKEFFRRMFAALGERGSWSGEIWNRRKDGELVLELMTISLVRGVDGAVANYVGVFTDITRQREQQERLLHTVRQLEEQEHLYRAILDTLPINVFVKDEDQRYLMVNDQAAALLGRPKDQVCGMSDYELFPPDTASRLREADAPVLSQLAYVVDENTIARAGGEMHLLAHKRGVEVGGRRLLVGASVDISSRRLAERRLADEREVLQLIAANAAEAEILGLICRRTEQYLHGGLASILLVDESGTRLRPGAAPSLPASYLKAMDGLEIGPAAGSAGAAAHLATTVVVDDVQTDARWAGFRELAARHDLRACWSTPILAAAGSVLGVFSQYYRSPRRPNALEVELADQGARLAGIAIERAQAGERLHRMATLDALTNLPNRPHFFTLARRALAQAGRNGRPLAAFMIDVDFFKRINDCHGHGAGDQALRVLARRFAGEIRGSDLLGRLGGEEFAVLLPETDQATAEKVAERLRRLVADTPFRLDESLELPVTVSIGVGMARDGDDLDRLLARTDRALYEAKHGGRNQVRLA